MLHAVGSPGGREREVALSPQQSTGKTRTLIPDVLTFELAADRVARAGVDATGSSRNDRHSGLVLPRSNV